MAIILSFYFIFISYKSLKSNYLKFCYFDIKMAPIQLFVKHAVPLRDETKFDPHLQNEILQFVYNFKRSSLTKSHGDPSALAKNWLRLCRVKLTQG